MRQRTFHRAPKAAGLVSALAAMALAACTAGAQGTQATAAAPKRGPTVIVGAPPLAAEWFAAVPGAPTLVFLHGWCEHRRVWAPLAEALGKDRWNLVALDLPGHGESEWPSGGATPRDLARMVASALSEFAPSPVILVGHSYAGILALEIAALEGGPELAGVIVLHGLYDPSQPFDRESTEIMAQTLEADFEPNIRKFAEGICPKRMPEPVRRWVADQMAGQTPAAMVTILRGLEGWDLRPTLQAIQVPVWALNGSYRPTRTEVVRRWLADFHVEVLPWTEGIGFAPMLQDPAACAEAVEAVVAKLIRIPATDSR